MKRRRNRRQDTRLLLLFAAGGLFAAALVGLLLSNQMCIRDSPVHSARSPGTRPRWPARW